MATFGCNQTAVPKAPTVPTSKVNKGKGKEPAPEASQMYTLDRRLRSNNSPESILDLSLLSEAPPSPGAMPDSTEVAGSATLGTGVHRSEVPAMSLPQSGSSTATALTSPDNANTANLILAALLKVTQGQDALLQHLQATRPPL